MTNSERIYGATPLERLLAHSIELPNGCIVWQGNKNKMGYGRFKVDHRSVQTHRYAYEAQVGPIPEGMTIDHLCRNRACINVAHLEVVTMKVNTLRGDTVAARFARRTHCEKGHLLERRGSRRLCPICVREKSIAYARKHLGYKTVHNKWKTHCIRGHEFTPENTMITKAGRSCRICNRDRARAKYAEDRPNYKPLMSLRKES